MPKIFKTLDKIEPIYAITEKIVMFICKVLLVVDIVIAIYTVLGRYCNQLAINVEFLSFLSVIKDPAWSEQVILTCMSYMAVLAAALAIRKGTHIRMTALDRFLPPMVVKILDIISDAAVMVLGFVMLIVGWQYSTTLGGRGFYESIPWLSRFWMYFPVPLAGAAMIIFEIEALYRHIKSFFIKDGMMNEEEKGADDNG